MKRALASFYITISTLQNSRNLLSSIKQQGISTDPSDLLRWQWVLAVSALDKYIHDVVRIGMVQQFLGQREKTSKYKAFPIVMDSYAQLTDPNSADPPAVTFEKEVMKRNSQFAYQHPTNISDALSYVWEHKKKWETIAEKMKGTATEKNMEEPITAETLRKSLIRIVTRRNQIVHEADYDDPISTTQAAIREVDVDIVVQFITDLVDAISKSIP